MFQKEKGYDEFLAEKIQRGREDVAAGRVCSREALNAHIANVLAQKERELAEITHENLAYA